MLKSWMLSFTPRSPACLPLHAYAMRARTPFELDVQVSSALVGAHNGGALPHPEAERGGN